MDRRCGVPNTFLTRNKTSELKDQDFFTQPCQIQKNDIFFKPRISNKIKQSQVTNCWKNMVCIAYKTYAADN